MEIKPHFTEKLSELLFVEVSKKKIKEIFKTDLNKEIYMPIKSSDIVENVKEKENIDAIPISYFIEAMYYVMGADEKFKFNDAYGQLLKNIDESSKFIKGKIYKLIEKKNYEEAYLLLKGLCNIETEEENFEKLLMLADKLRNLDKRYKDEELQLIETYKKKFEEAATPYAYESIIKKDLQDFQGALFSLNNYIARGGEETSQITDMKIWLKGIVNYDRGKELLNEDPEGALKLLIPLIKEFEEDAVLYYYIAVGYRMLQNYEKAIYYLNESISIDSSIVEVINELGINYASLGDFNKAIAFLRKAFEATKSIEICTNLVMCYLNAGKLEDAKMHLTIAKKLDPEDEIVLELESILNNSK
nr:tetratricopeptide repeat protein [Clostridium rectalis]